MESNGAFIHQRSSAGNLVVAKLFDLAPCGPGYPFHALLPAWPAVSCLGSHCKHHSERKGPNNLAGSFGAPGLTGRASRATNGPWALGAPLVEGDFAAWYG
jgi:hypothetical protein